MTARRMGASDYKIYGPNSNRMVQGDQGALLKLIDAHATLAAAHHQLLEAHYTLANIVISKTSKF